jgi:ribosomal-protein-alanine N-acetyltransferase
MAGDYDIHLLTLPQVVSLLRVEGSWPGPITLSLGWFRARARPWNETVAGPMVRLDRGGADFLSSVVARLGELGASEAYSPALYPGSTRVWRRSGFTEYATLDVMERSLRAEQPDPGNHHVRDEAVPDWESLAGIDRLAFEGFWGMSILGLMEAHDTNRSTALLTVNENGSTVGYAIVGTQWGVSYLHRIAVLPAHGGSGIGASLMTASIRWGRANGGQSMVLNVRADNQRARRLYESVGFADTGTALLVLRHRVS